MKNHIIHEVKENETKGISRIQAKDLKAELWSDDIINKGIFQMQEQHELEVKALLDRNKKLLAIIGHDIKTPMGSIIGFLSVLKERINELDKIKIEEHIDIALLSAKKTFTLLDNLLEWALAENAIKSFQQEIIDLTDLLHEETESIRIFASHKQININTSNIPPEKVYIDKNMIRTVLRNLLNNAIKYTPKKGKIDVTAKRYNGFIEVSIRDNGVGVKKELQNLIFSTHNSTIGTDKETGTGYGLWLCKEFIDIHGGNIWIISEPGEGSELKFTLPVYSTSN